MYIVISGSDDAHIQFVEPHLDEPFVLLDARDILRNQACSYNMTERGSVSIKHGRTLTDIRGVWYRRFLKIQDSELRVADGYKAYTRQAVDLFNKLLLSQFSDAIWVSDHFAIERADSKLLQLQVAAGLGFNIPDTLFTASEKEAQDFVRRHKSVVAKPLAGLPFQKDGLAYGFYTSRVDERTNFSGLKFAPAILQQAINVKTELRITVVGNKVFAAAVGGEAKSMPGYVRDWRVASLNDQATFEPYELPSHIAERCVSLVKALGLKFGAIDVTLDHSNKFWFLENNPNGAWAFIELATGQPIGKAIAELLMKGKRKSG